MPDVRLVGSHGLGAGELASIRRLMNQAFGGEFTDDDWDHAVGGWHAVLGPVDDVVAHASVVERRLVVGTRAYRAGYVEAVAVMPDRQGTGLGTAVMAHLTEVVRERFELGALSTSAWRFYQRLGWERWRGPTWVQVPGGRRYRTPDEDDGVMVLRCPVTADLDTTLPITCEERAGDSW